MNQYPSKNIDRFKTCKDYNLFIFRKWCIKKELYLERGVFKKWYI